MRVPTRYSPRGPGRAPGQQPRGLAGDVGDGAPGPCGPSAVPVCSPLPGLPGGAHTARVLWAVPQGCGCWRICSPDRRWGVLEAEWEVWGPDGLRAGDLWLEERVP